MKRIILAIAAVALSIQAKALDHHHIASDKKGEGHFTLIDGGKPAQIVISDNEDEGVRIAAQTLSDDFGRVSGQKAQLSNQKGADRTIIIGKLGSKVLEPYAKQLNLDKELRGKWEKYIMATVDDALVIAGSDKRGTIYGIYELSEQIGVSPWYDWADVPVTKHQDWSIECGTYTAGEPAVRYRGIFLNDEAPCLTSWVKNTYGTDYGDHRFYARVFELLLRLRANFMWPAMWGWSFYADDPQNSHTANTMGIVMGTSHHEPMARNHQEWARNRNKYGVWDYASNQAVIDQFFREGIERALDTEDLITIGMRGDGDTALGGEEGHDDEYVNRDKENMALMERIFKNQRNIISKVTKKNAKERPQVWALYKEVQRFYDMGLRVPDDVIILLSDDNWGDVRRLPSAEERKHPGGWGMYYHVDYVGAPRNSKWLNVTPVQNLWEQMQLTYNYGVDKLWVLNVGDLKPMEYPISLFLDMAWHTPDYKFFKEAQDHLFLFCAQQFGQSQAAEASRILNLACKYNGRVTPEMLDAQTYNIESGEWARVVAQYDRLEADALRQYISLDPEYRDAYKQLVLFPVQAMTNLYNMYYAQAMNHKLYAEGKMGEINQWADRVHETFERDAALCLDYNKTMAGGKWDGMMTQKHIGYTQWNDNFAADTEPATYRTNEWKQGGYVFEHRNGCVVMEAEHYYTKQSPNGTYWNVIEDMGRTLSGIAVMPYTQKAEGAHLEYKMTLPKGTTEATVRVVVKSTLPFLDKAGHVFRIAMDGGEAIDVNFNSRLNEEPENVYTLLYPTVAKRVIETTTKVTVAPNTDVHTLTISPIHPATVFEKVIVDFGGYEAQYLFGEESPSSVDKNW